MVKLLSFSSVDLFDTCERKWYYEKILGDKEPENANLVVGNVYHSAIAEAQRGATDLAAVARTAIAGSADKLAAVAVSAEALQEELTFNLGRLLEFLAGAETDYLPTGEAFIEQRFEDQELGYRGVIDWVLKNTPVTTAQGKITGWKPGRCILDYKSLTSDRRRTERDARVSAQLGLYAIVTQSPSACFLEIPRNTEAPLQCRVVTYGANDLRWMEIWLRSRAETILSRGDVKAHYAQTPRDNGLCSPTWCAHWFKCYPNVEQTLPIPPAQSPSDGQVRG